jgi:hypothetical protein
VLDDIAWPARARPSMSQGVAFFNRFRDLTASGFFSSRMGVEDLEYTGNRALREWRGCPQEVVDHLDVSYEAWDKLRRREWVSGWGSGSWGAASTRAFTSRRSGGCGTPTCWECGARTGTNAASAAALARELGVGDAKAVGSITDMVADPDIDAIWLCGPNQARVENVEEIVRAIRTAGRR